MGSCEAACAPTAPSAPRIIEERQIGTSFEGRPIIASRLGTPGGAFVVELSTNAAGGMSPKGVTNHVNAFFAAATA